MIRRFLQSFRHDQRGVAAVEFALWTTSFFLVVMIAIDFGAYYVQRSTLNAAVGAAAVAAFNEPDNVNFTDMAGYVRSLSGDQSATVGLSCNGVAASCTNLNRTCSCLKTDGTYVSAACGASCTGTGMTAGSTAGYYFTIDATRPFEAMIIPNSVIDGAAVAQRATVRLQ